MEHHRTTTDRWVVPANDWVALIPNHHILSGFLTIENGAQAYFRGIEPGGHYALLDAGTAIVDAGGGVVTLPAANHGLVIDGTETMEIFGLEHYSGTETILNSSTTDTLDITATYVAETVPTEAYVVGEGYYDAKITGSVRVEGLQRGKIFGYMKGVAGSINVSLLGETP